ncbi:MAG: hypothetical protein E6Q97_34130 [Desulfurellales bacterium]|nr:MAG: hypothetical protein E6Q97_34130 [Desulfurellales bacterium]
MLGDLIVNLGMNTAGFNAGLAQGNRGLSSLASGASRSMGLIKGALAPLAPIAAAVGAAMGFVSSINSAREAVQQQNKLQAVIKATGGAAGLTASQMMNLANDMSSLTDFEDDAVVGAQAILATFKEVKGDHFAEATRLAGDMASVLGGDLNGSIMQIGKALNDPVKGMTALSRSGVSFTEQQKQQIKAMQAAGDIAGAQRIILAELKSEFGGAAEAMSDPFVRVWNVIGNVGESIGMLFLPAINAISVGFAEILGPVANSGDALGELGKKIGVFVGEYIQPFVGGLKTAFEFIAGGIGNIGPVIDSVTGMMGGIKSYIVGLFEPALPAFQAAFDYLVGGFTTMLTPAIGKSEELILSVGVAISDLVDGALTVLGTLGETFMTLFQPLYDSIASLLAEWFPGLMSGFQETGDFLGEVVGGIAFFFRNMSALSQIAVIDLITAIIDNVPFAEEAFTAIGATVVGVFSGIQAGVTVFVQNVIAGFQEIVNFGKAAFTAIGEAFSAMLAGKNPLEAFQNSFTETLASQQDVQGGGNPFTAFQESFKEGRDGFLASVASDGGLRESLAKQKEALQGSINQREQDFQLQLNAPVLATPGVTPPAVTETSGTPAPSTDLGKYVKTEAVNQGSKEAASAINEFLYGGTGDTSKQQLETSKQQLDAIEEQNGILADMRDGMAEDRSRDEMDPGI